MPLINCPECEKEVSTEATSCPSCGPPLHKKPKKDSKPTKPAGCFMQLLAIPVFLAGIGALTNFAGRAPTARNFFITVLLLGLGAGLFIWGGKASR